MEADLKKLQGSVSNLEAQKDTTISKRGSLFKELDTMTAYKQISQKEVIPYLTNEDADTDGVELGNQGDIEADETSFVSWRNHGPSCLVII